MGILINRLSNSWEARLVGVFLKSLGLDEDDNLNKYICRFHTAMMVPVAMYICFGFCGVFIKLTGRGSQFMFIDLFSFVFFSLLYIDVAFSYSYIYKRHQLIACIEHFNETLHCSSLEEEDLAWQKYRKLFKFFISTYFSIVYPSVFVDIVILPVIRFRFKFWTSFVVWPIWYPIDVVSVPALFWIVYVVESIMLIYLIHCVLNGFILFLYIAILTTIRFNILGSYMEKMTVQLLDMEMVRTDTKNRIKKTLSNRSIKTINTTATQKLKDCVRDLNTLQRQKKLVNGTFAVYLSLIHALSLIANAVLPFSAACEIRDAGKVTPVGLLFFTFALGCIYHIFIYSYLTTKLQESHDRLLHSLWKSDWFLEKRVFQKLFLRSEVALSQLLTLKTYSFYPINLQTFADSLITSLSICLFLYQISSRQ